jgi:hypothetical protein
VALVLDSTPFSPTQNSYASASEVNAYVQNRLVSATLQTSWDNLDAPVQAAYIVNATRALDNICSWIGVQYSRDQLLRWPRTNAWIENFQLDVTTTPTPVKEATAEMAVWLMSNDGSALEQGNEAYNRIQVGPIRIQFNENSGSPATRYMPDVVAQILRDYATFDAPSTPGGKQAHTAYLQRS